MAICIFYMHRSKSVRRSLPLLYLLVHEWVSEENETDLSKPNWRTFHSGGTGENSHEPRKCPKPIRKDIMEIPIFLQKKITSFFIVPRQVGFHQLRVDVDTPKFFVQSTQIDKWSCELDLIQSVFETDRWKGRQLRWPNAERNELD